MRALLLILDSVGCGDAPDAASFGDEGANTLGHLLEAFPDLELPNLMGLGLWKIITGDVLAARSRQAVGRWGRMRQRSRGKDSVTGHWEIAGAVLAEPFATFDRMPEDLVKALSRECGTEFLGNYARSGTVILEELGLEHLETRKPILYTSADSVLQIAAHEQVMPVARLHDVCRRARRLADRWRIGRVIARPFTGKPGAFERTQGRHDYAMVPPRTILNAIAERGFTVHGIGKVSDIFGGSGITRSTPTTSNEDGMRQIEAAWAEGSDGLVFANLVDFDTLYGHRRDVEGYGRALADFDAWLGPFLATVEPDDLVIITADHGNDPAFAGTDHTREEVPLLVAQGNSTGPLGTRPSFADVAATLGEFFRAPWTQGTSFLKTGRDPRPAAAK